MYSSTSNQPKSGGGSKHKGPAVHRRADPDPMSSIAVIDFAKRPLKKSTIKPAKEKANGSAKDTGKDSAKDTAKDSAIDTANEPAKQKGRVSIDVTGQASQGEAPASPGGKRRTTVVLQDVSGLREQIIGKSIGSALHITWLSFLTLVANAVLLFPKLIQEDTLNRRPVDMFNIVVRIYDFETPGEIPSYQAFLVQTDPGKRRTLLQAREENSLLGTLFTLLLALQSSCRTAKTYLQAISMSAKMLIEKRIWLARVRGMWMLIFSPRS